MDDFNGLCSANAGGDPASGCDQPATGPDGLCDRHRAAAERLEKP